MVGIVRGTASNDESFKVVATVTTEAHMHTGNSICPCQPDSWYVIGVSGVRKSGCILRMYMRLCRLHISCEVLFCECCCAVEDAVLSLGSSCTMVMVDVWLVE